MAKNDIWWPNAVDNPDYDKGEVSRRELEAAKRQNRLGEYNANSAVNQFRGNIKGLDFADRQNERLRDKTLVDNSLQADEDRFKMMKDLQSVALGLLSSFGTAGNSSTVNNFMRMMERRNDTDNITAWDQLRANNETTYNAFNESANQNQAARFNAYTDANKAVRDIGADLYANISNINPNLLKTEGGGEKDIDFNPNIGKLASDLQKEQDALKERDQLRSGYIMPDNSVQQIQGNNYANRNRLGGNDYYSRLINGFNGRR